MYSLRGTCSRVDAGRCGAYDRNVFFNHHVVVDRNLQMKIGGRSPVSEGNMNMLQTSRTGERNIVGKLVTSCLRNYFSFHVMGTESR